MSVRAYNPQDNSAVLLSDAEAADAITSGRYVLAEDQAVPVRTPSGAIERYRAADLPNLLSRQGYALDFVNGNQQRYTELYNQRTSQVLRDDYGALGEITAAAAMGAADAVSMGLADISEQQSEDERLASVQSNAPNQGKLEAYLNSGIPYDDALILANDSYRRPTLREATAASSPFAAGVGSVTGFLGGAIATAPVAIAAEGAIAGRAAAALAARGLGQTASTVAGRVAAGAAVGATEAAATGAAVRVGEGIIRDRLPEFSGEELMVLGGLGAVVGGGLNLAANIPTMLRSRAAGNQAPLVAPVISNRDAIDRLNNDITASLAPESTTRTQDFIAQMNQTVGQVDPVLNRSFFNPVKENLANIADEAHDEAGRDIASAIADVQSRNNVAEVAVATQARQDLSNSVTNFVDSADDVSIMQAGRRLTEYVDTLEDSFRLNGRNIMEGRDSPIAGNINRFIRGVRDATAEVRGGVRRVVELEQALETAARPAREARMAEALERVRASRAVSRESPFAMSDEAFEEYVSNGLIPSLNNTLYSRASRSAYLPPEAIPMEQELAAVTRQTTEAYKALPDVLVNQQTNLANLSRRVRSVDEQDLAQAADEALRSFDNFLARPDVFGPSAREAFRDVPVIRTMQSNRNQLLKLFGRDGISELDRVERDFDPAKLVDLSMRMSDNDTLAGRKVLADYLRASRQVAEIEGRFGNTVPVDAINDIATRLVGPSDRVFPGQEPFFAVGRAKADFKLLQQQGNQGGTLRGVAPSIMSGMFGGLIASGQVVPAAALATMMAMRPDKRVAASYAIRNLRSALDRTKSQLVTAIGNRLSLSSTKLSVSKQVARKVITATPELFEGEDRDQAFDRLVGVVNEAAGNPDYMAGAAESLGINSGSRTGSEAIANMVTAMEYLRQQMPESLFDPMNPNPPSQRVSGMVKFNILRTVEAIMDPLSVEEDFTNGFVSATKVQARRAVYPQLAEEMNARVLAEYADRVSAGVRMPYATRMQTSMLLGTPIEQALRQPNLARLQSVYAQTPAQAQAQGMSRTPTRAVTSLVTSTTTEGSSLQDLQ